MQPTIHHAPLNGGPRFALSSLALAVLLAALGSSSANAGLPALAAAFDAGFAQVQWIVLAYVLATTLLVLGAGRLGDIFGHRRLLLGGLLVFTWASLACGVAPSLAWLIGARGFQGAGAALMMTLAMALARRVAGQGGAGRAIGLLGAMSAAGTAAGPALGGLMLSLAGWQALFLVQVPLGIFALLLGMRCLPRDQASVGVHGVPTRAGMLRQPMLAAALAANLLATCVVMTSLVVGPFYLAGALGMGAMGIGLAMSAGPLVAALTALPAGVLVDRLGSAKLGAVGLAAMTAGALLLAVMPVGAGVAGYIGALAVITAGYAVFQTANNTFVMTAASGAGQGTAAGLLALSRNLGLATGASAMGAVFAWGTGTGGPAGAAPAALAAGMHLAFALAAGLTGLALMVTVALPAIARRARAQSLL